MAPLYEHYSQNHRGYTTIGPQYVSWGSFYVGVNFTAGIRSGAHSFPIMGGALGLNDTQECWLGLCLGYLFHKRWI